MKNPNILFLFPDQHRGDWMPYTQDILNKLDVSDLQVEMPNIKKLMNNGVSFTRAITPSPLCAPARACLASGLRYIRCQVENNDKDYPLHIKTFYSKLKENGYNVGGVGKFDLHKLTNWWGLDGWVDEFETIGFTHAIDNAGKYDAVDYSTHTDPKDPYMLHLKNAGYGEIHTKDIIERKNETYPTPLPDEHYCDNWLTQNGIKMLNAFEKNKPWFLQVNFTGPHNPWDITKSMKEKWENVKLPAPVNFVGNDDINSIRQNYMAMLENIDKNIGLLLDTVSARGELENTLIVYSADHGEMLGDFGQYGKSKPQRGSVSIPLVVSGPGVAKGLVSDALVELQDLTNTFINYSLNENMEEALDSISLKPILEGNLQIKHREYQISSLMDINIEKKHAFDGWQMICDGQYKYYETETGKEALFNISSDIWEKENIIDKNKEKAKELKELLNKQ